MDFERTLTQIMEKLNLDPENQRDRDELTNALNSQFRASVKIKQFLLDQITPDEFVTWLQLEDEENDFDEPPIAEPSWPPPSRSTPRVEPDKNKKRIADYITGKNVPATHKKRFIIARMVQVIIIICTIAGGLFWFFSNRTTPEPNDFTFTPLVTEEAPAWEETAPETTETTPETMSNTNQGNEITLDETWWEQIAYSKVPEYSPGANKALNEKTIAGAIMVIFIIAWAVVDALPRREDQKGAVVIAVSGVLAGVLTVPLLNWASAPEQSVGSLFTTSLFLVILWAGAVFGAVTHKDWTALGVALTLTTAMIFFTGKLTLPVGLNQIYNKSWPAWEGVTSFSGWIVLNMGFRFAEGALTGLLLLFGLLSFLTVLKEVSKRSSFIGAIVLGTGTIILWALLNWGLTSLVQWIINAQDMIAIKIATLEVIRVIIVWLLGTVIMVGIGIGLSDKNLPIMEREISLGLRSEGESALSTASNFIIFATTISLLGILIKF